MSEEKDIVEEAKEKEQLTVEKYIYIYGQICLKEEDQYKSYCILRKQKEEIRQLLIEKEKTNGKDGKTS